MSFPLGGGNSDSFPCLGYRNGEIRSRRDYSPDEARSASGITIRRWGQFPVGGIGQAPRLPLCRPPESVETYGAPVVAPVRTSLNPGTTFSQHWQWSLIRFAADGSRWIPPCGGCLGPCGLSGTICVKLCEICDICGFETLLIRSDSNQGTCTMFILPDVTKEHDGLCNLWF